jgi:hypothetical protein
MQLTPTFLPFLLEFASNFTPASHVTFVALMTGWLLSHRHRFLTELIRSSGSTHTGHHSRYHRFFGLHATLRVKVRQALYYGPARTAKRWSN